MGVKGKTAQRVILRRQIRAKKEAESYRAAMERIVTKPVRWVLCWGKINYRTGKWEWKNEHSFENRDAAVINKNSFLLHPVVDQNACYVVRRYEHGHQNTAEAMEGVH